MTLGSENIYEGIYFDPRSGRAGNSLEQRSMGTEGDSEGTLGFIVARGRNRFEHD